MRERPILFKGPMVQAILDGTKTQTRRVIKPQESVHGPCEDGMLYWIPKGMRGDPEPNFPRTRLIDKCRQGQPGDRLWVKETWQACNECGCINYRADTLQRACAGCDAPFGKWKPSIFMFRSDSRIDLDVLVVRAEQLWDITEEEAVTEGCEPAEYEGQWSGADGCVRPVLVGDYAKDRFEKLWDSINSEPKPVKRGGKIVHYESYPWVGGSVIQEHRGLPWHVYGNPFVFATTFKLVRP